jgi:recombination protein RecA
MSKKKIKIKQRKITSNDGLYFSEDNKDIEFVTSGCMLLDCALGGGYATGRIINIVGDKSTGKTLQAIELCANFRKTYPDSLIHYIETEAAFDEDYAESLGMPIDSINFENEMDTVEDIFEYLTELIENGSDEKHLVIVDSLDAVSDRAEKKRKIDKGTYGQEKAKKMSELFRRLNKSLSQSDITLVIVSQIRDKMNVMFGKKVSRAGGKALDFYASQVVYLSNLGRVKKTSEKVTRVIGVKIKALIEKNKVGVPFRECEFPIIFNYGIDDVQAGVNFLIEVDAIRKVGLKKSSAIKDIAKLNAEDYKKFRIKLNKVLKVVWRDIEKRFMPTKGSKY